MKRVLVVTRWRLQLGPDTHACEPRRTLQVASPAGVVTSRRTDPASPT